jgi:hypothetical protein
VFTSRLMAARKTTKTAKKKSTTPKKRSGKGRGGRPRGRAPRDGTKTSFILGLPLDMPAKEAVAAGEKAGHSYDIKYVYSVRSASRRKDGAQAAAPRGDGSPRRGRGRPRKTATSTTAAAGNQEAEFARMAVNIGIARAESILRRVREQLDRLTF